jgi:hypothetical protein
MNIIFLKTIIYKYDNNYIYICLYLIVIESDIAF